MQSIITKRSNRYIIAKHWKTTAKISYDLQLSDLENHTVAALNVVDVLTSSNPTNPMEIVNFADSVDPNGGYVFLIDYLKNCRSSSRGITVKSMSGTAKRRAFLRVFSWWNPGGRNVQYGTHYDNWESSDGCARYAAETELKLINDVCNKNGVNWALDQYINTYDGNAVFSLKLAPLNKG